MSSLYVTMTLYVSELCGKYIVSCVMVTVVTLSPVVLLLTVQPKFSRIKIFVDFMVFGAPTKFLSMKISHLAVVA